MRARRPARLALAGLAGAVLAGAAMFAWGLAAGVYHVFPYETLRAAKNAVDDPPDDPPYIANPRTLAIAQGLQKWGSKADIVMVGDSLTQQARWREMFPGVSILNRGIGGDNAGGVARRAHLVLEAEPKAIFLMVGLNDIFYPENSDEEVIEQFDRAIAALSQGGAELFVQSIIICNSDNPVCPPERQARLARFNTALERLAQRHCATFIDIAPLFAGPRGLREELSWDGMHLNGEGYGIWQEALRDHIARVERGETPEKPRCTAQEARATGQSGSFA